MGVLHSSDPFAGRRAIPNQVPRRYLKQRSPTSSDTNISVGDIWMNITDKLGFICVANTGGVATWYSLGGSGGGDPVEIKGDFISGVLAQAAEGAASATQGYRYISTATGTLWTDTYVYTYESGAWEEFIPTEGCIAWDENTSTFLYYTGAAWAAFPGTAAATETTAGIVELATTAETTTGTDTTRAVTAAGVAAKLGAQTDHGVLVGSGSTAAVTPLAVGTDGQILVGASTADPAWETLTSSDSTITFTGGAGTLSIQAAAASLTQAGVVERATNAEITTGTDDTRYITPKGFADNLGVTADASTTVKGISELATDAEAVTGTDTARTIVCSSLTAKMSAPGAIGDTTPLTAVFTDLTSGGATSLQAGQVDIATDNAANAVNIGLGSTPRAIAIGTGAAHTLTIGASTGAASTDILVGTGNFTCTGAATSAYTIGTGAVAGTILLGGVAQTGTITLGSSSGTNTIAISAGVGKGTVNIAAGLLGSTVSVANGANSVAQTINLAGGANAANSTVNIHSGNASAGTQTTNINTGTRAGVCNICTGAAANVTTIGSNNAAAQVDIIVGTGNFSVDGAATSTYTIGATTTSGTIDIGGTSQTGTMTFGDSDGTNIVQIGSGEGATTVAICGGATSAKAVDIGIGAVSNVIRIGSASSTSSLALKVGTGHYSLDGAATSTYTVGASTVAGTMSYGGTAATGTMTFGDSSATSIVEIAAGEGASTCNICSGATSAKAVNICQGAIAGVIAIGNATGASQLDLKAGSGNFSLDGAAATVYTIGASTTTGTMTIGGTAATGAMTFGDSSATNIVHIGAGEGATTINIGSGATSAKVVNIAEGAVANLVTIGSVSGAASLDLLAGTGNFSLEGNVATTYAISNVGVNTGQVDIAGGTGARTINLGLGGTGIKTISVGTAATADVIALGSTTGAGSTTISAGSGSIIHVGPNSYTPDAITSDTAGVAASIATVVTEITTDGDVNLDNVTLANGIDGQIKIFAVVAVGNSGDSVKITPASMIGGSQITFAANPLGLGCMMVYDAGAAGWVIVGNNSGTVT